MSSSLLIGRYLSQLIPSYTTIFLVLSALLAPASASVIGRSPPPDTEELSDPHVILDHSTNVTIVYSASTGDQIAQGDATDGGGTGQWDAPAIIWVAFCFAVGVPMLLAGFRGRRLSCGAALGLAVAIAAWAAVVNCISEGGVPDTVIAVFVMVLFFVAFAVGLPSIFLPFAPFLLALDGGVSIGIRIVLLRGDLLAQGQQAYPVNWVIVALCGALSVLCLSWRSQATILVACASIGSFLAGLGIDLAVNHQHGMSLGLRYLMDRNASHVMALLSGYHPPASTIALIAASLVVIPPFAYAQHRLFPVPFIPEKQRRDTESVYTVDPKEEGSEEQVCASGAPSHPPAYPNEAAPRYSNMTPRSSIPSLLPKVDETGEESPLPRKGPVVAVEAVEVEQDITSEEALPKPPGNPAAAPSAIETAHEPRPKAAHASS